VLDAPELQDDFYLNLVDWSAQNVLAVGLGSCVYLWSACTSQVSFFFKLIRSTSLHRADDSGVAGHLVAVHLVLGYLIKSNLFVDR
jgi:cell division cycle 20-like protein 1 (cofactor of APC complex)